ncbi:hypothetical protein JOF53_001052 [Crossiella equi]|uniref:Uncharacterized protein n=1 Tax=Crossiella equi TaxID=130796 RepID=A0ABS5A8Y2_9PSEU|nr:hypothetical protein [Crossiella equi]
MSASLLQQLGGQIVNPDDVGMIGHFTRSHPRRGARLPRAVSRLR